jgi:protein-tyrosine kinase
MNGPAERSNVVSVAGKGGPSATQIGALLVDAGRIIPQDAERILRHAKEHGIRFGDAAMQLGLVSREEIDRIVAQQFGYPYLVPGESAVSTEIVAAYAPFSAQVEGLRALRSQLLLRWFDGEAGRNKLAIVSPDRRDGRSYLTANLAVVFSQLGERTLLIDADLRNPRQHDIFGLSNSIGLSTILSGRASLEAIQRITSFVALSVLTAGPTPPNPQELVNRESFASLLDEVGRLYDVVLMDTAGATLSADAQAIAARAGGALVLVRANRTKLDRVKRVNEDLAASGISLVGAVVNQK